MKILRCALCELDFEDIKGLSIHLTKLHKLSPLQRHEYLLKNHSKYYVCKNCGKPLTINRVRLFCNNSCYNESQRKLQNKIGKSKCEICGIHFKDTQILGFHISHVHKNTISIEEYYKKYIQKDPNEGYCLWCHKKLNFTTLKHGYNRFCYNTDCNVRWYNTNEDRAKNSGKAISKSLKHGKLPTQKEYWIKKGFSEEESINKVTERQTTFTLEKCKEKHGKINGRKIWQERQDKWQTSLKNKSDEEIDDMNRRKVQTKGISKPEKIIKKELKFSKKETQVTLRKSTRRFIYDFCRGKKIIEFNGDYWHCNPLMYKRNFYNKVSKKYAWELWKKDKEKLEMANKLGYEVLVIWEKDWNENRQEVFKKCEDFINS
jgi:hypothetical protein